MVNLVWLADGNTAICSWLALLCAGLLVVPRPTEWRHLLPFIITASSLFIISSSSHWTCFPWTTNITMKARSQGSKALRRRGTGKNHSFYRLSRYPCAYVRIQTKKRRRHVGPTLPYAVSALNRMGPGPWQTAVGCTCNWQGYSIQYSAI